MVEHSQLDEWGSIWFSRLFQTTPHSPRFPVFSRTGTVVDLYQNQSLIRDLRSINSYQGLISIPPTQFFDL